MPAQKVRKGATKKAPVTPKKEAKTIPPKYQDEMGQLILPADMMWKWKALSSDIELQTIKAQKAKIEFENIVEKTAELVHLRHVRTASQRQRNISIEEYNSLVKQVQEETGLDLSTCTIDDMTGRITVLEELQPQAPADEASDK